MANKFLKVLFLFSLISIPLLVHAETKVLFSPNGGCQETIIAEIGKAHRSIDIAMFALTSRRLPTPDRS